MLLLKEKEKKVVVDKVESHCTRVGSLEIWGFGLLLFEVVGKGDGLSTCPTYVPLFWYITLLLIQFIIITRHKIRLLLLLLFTTRLPMWLCAG